MSLHKPNLGSLDPRSDIPSNGKREVGRESRVGEGGFKNDPKSRILISSLLHLRLFDLREEKNENPERGKKSIAKKEGLRTDKRALPNKVRT